MNTLSISVGGVSETKSFPEQYMNGNKDVTVLPRWRKTWACVIFGFREFGHQVSTFWIFACHKHAKIFCWGLAAADGGSTVYMVTGLVCNNVLAGGTYEITTTWMPGLKLFQQNIAF